MSDVPPSAGLGGRRAASGSHVGPLRESFTAWRRPPSADYQPPDGIKTPGADGARGAVSGRRELGPRPGAVPTYFAHEEMMMTTMVLMPWRA